MGSGGQRRGSGLRWPSGAGPPPNGFAAVGSARVVLRVLGRHADSLTHSEQGRCARLRRAADRDDFVSAHLLARACAAAALAVPLTDVQTVQTCETCSGPHGRPRIDGHPDVHVSWSHSAGTVAAVVTRSPVGVDVERRRPVRDGSLPSTVLTSGERRLLGDLPSADDAALRQWVRKESLVKLGRLTLDDVTAVGLEEVLGRRHDRPHALTVAGASLQLLDLGSTADPFVGAIVGVDLEQLAVLAVE